MSIAQGLVAGLRAGDLISTPNPWTVPGSCCYHKMNTTATVVVVPLTSLSREELAKLEQALLGVMGSSSWLIRVQPKLLH